MSTEFCKFLQVPGHPSQVATMFTLATVKHWSKVAFSAGIRLPESRRNLSLTPMYVTMATFG